MDREGWKGLECLARSDDPKVALEAIRLIAAYGIGKPTEQIDVTSAGAPVSVNIVNYSQAEGKAP
jgi:hypothetical protein